MSSSPRVLVVDDEEDLRDLLEITLVRMGLDVDGAGDLRQARRLFAAHDYDLVLTDMRLPDGVGLDFVREIVAGGKQVPVAVITAFGSAENAVVALKAGAFDYVTKPLQLDQLRMIVQSALKLNGPAAPAAPQEQPVDSRLKGQSAAMQALRAQIARLARSMAPIAITGESGSGKELAAREIHARGARADKPFVAVNCGAIPEALMEAEFFGYRKGAFTGAADERDGFFQAANGGTLMLDEVADLPLPMQVKLLRAIQERRVRKIGATAEEPVDVRIVSATHRDLARWVEEGRFRQDLFYRLNVIELALPPLRERLDDLPVLTDAILARLSTGGQRAVLGPGVLDALRGYGFPGNVRELENILERALAFSNDGVIAVEDLALKGAKLAGVPAAPATASMSAGTSPAATLPAAATVGPTGADPATAGPITARPTIASPTIASPTNATTAAASPAGPLAAPAGGPGTGTATPAGTNEAMPPLPDLSVLPANLPAYLERVEREIITRALARTHYNRTQAAQLLGISFRQLRYQMQKLGIQEPDA